MGGASSRRSKESEQIRHQVGLDVKQVQLICESWNDIKAYGTDEIGKTVFKKLFLTVPDTFNMFIHFRDIPNWSESVEYHHHCTVVMHMIGGAIGLLRDPDSLQSTMEYMGLRHEGFAITQMHFDIFGDQLLITLHEALGDKVTPDVDKAWRIFYAYMVRIIMVGMTDMENMVNTIMNDNQASKPQADQAPIP